MGILRNIYTRAYEGRESFMRGYRYTDEEHELSQARDELKEKMRIGITTTGTRYKLNVAETLDSVKRGIPGRPRRVIRGCRRVVRDLLRSRRSKD